MAEMESKTEPRPMQPRKIVDVPDLGGPQNTTLQKLLTEEETLKKELENLEHACSSDEAAEKIQQYISQTREPLSHFDEGPWGQCFTNDTLILLEHNEYKRIDEININDRVLSFDLKNDKYLSNSNFRQDGYTACHTQYKKTLSSVRRVHKSLTNKIIHLTFHHENDKNIVLKCTQDHPIWTTTKGWCNISGKHISNNQIDRISLLQVEDKCLLFNGDIVTLSDIQIINHNDPIYVYNLTVDNTQTFFANDILVHNKPCGDGCCIIL